MERKPFRELLKNKNARRVLLVALNTVLFYMIYRVALFYAEMTDETIYAAWIMGIYAAVLLGFVLGSLVKVWPWSNPEAIRLSQGLEAGMPYAPHIAAAVLWCLIGVALVLGTDYLGRRRR